MESREDDNSATGPRTPSPTRRTISPSATTNAPQQTPSLHDLTHRPALADDHAHDRQISHDQTESQLISTFVFLAANLALSETVDASVTNLLDRLRNKDLGVLNPHLVTLGYGSSFIVDAFSSDANVVNDADSERDDLERSLIRRDNDKTLKPIPVPIPIPSSRSRSTSAPPPFPLIVFKRTIPTPLTSASTTRHQKPCSRISALLLELRVLAHPPLRSHPNIVSLLGVAWETDPGWNPGGDSITRKWPVLIMERAGMGTLEDFFAHHQHQQEAQKSSSSSISINVRLKLALDVVQGLQALHACGVLHGDVKTTNVLVFDGDDPSSQFSSSCSGGAAAAAQNQPCFFTAKLADFSGVLYDAQDDRSVILPSGTRPWNAPEWNRQLRGRKALLKTDVYSLGLLIWRIVEGGRHPFVRSRNNEEDEGAWDEVETSKHVDDSDDEDGHGVGGGGLRSYMKSLPLSSLSLETYGQVNLERMLSDVLDCTVRRDPDMRDLERVEKILRKAEGYQSPKAILDFNNLQPRQLQLKSLSLPFSYFGIDSVDRGIAEHITSELIRTTQTTSSSKQKEQASEAAYGLGVLPINGITGDARWATRRDEGLKWLGKAARLGSDRAQAVFGRMRRTFDSVSDDTLSADYYDDEAKQWLWRSASRGFFVAAKELEELQFEDTLRDAMLRLRGRYGGTGAERFADAFFPENFPHAFDRMRAQRARDIRQLQDSTMSRFGDNILHFAVSCGLILTAEKLIGNVNREALDATNVNGETPLLLACRAGQYSCTMMLIEAGANPMIASDYGDTPLHWLLSFDNVYVDEVTQKLVQQGGEVDAVAEKWQYIHCGENAFIAGTPLMRAVTRNNFKVVEALLEKGADPNFTTNGASAINMAAFLHCPEILEVLISRTADQPPTVEKSTGKSLLIRAIMGGSLEANGSLFGRIRRHGIHWCTNAQKTLRVLLDHGAGDHVQDMPGHSGLTAVFLAATVAEQDILEFLLQNGCIQHINTFSTLPSQPETRRSPLAATIKSRNIEAFEILLKYGADVKVRQPLAEIDEPVTLLYECAWVANDDPELAETLIKCGVDVNDSPIGYETPLGCALRNRCFSLARCLIDNNADINVEYDRGLFFYRNRPMTVLAHLVAESSISTLYCLNALFRMQNLSHRANFIVNRHQGLNVLHVIANAAFQQDDRAAGMILETLLSNFDPTDAELNMAFSDKRYTALHLAVLGCNYAVVRGLLSAGVDISAKCADGFTALELARNCANAPEKAPERLRARKSAIARFIDRVSRAAESVAD